VRGEGSEGAMTKNKDKPKKQRRHPPVLAHESLVRIFPELRTLVPQVAAALRAKLKLEPHETFHEEQLQESTPLMRLLGAHAEACVYLDGLGEEDAATDANLLGHHLFHLLNYELHGRKTFWVDAPLAAMLMETRLDIDGAVLRLPFPTCAFVLTDPASLALAAELLEASDVERDPPRVVTAYLVDLGERVAGTSGLRIHALIDSLDGEWPYILSRDLLIHPKDGIDSILESHFPEVKLEERDEIFTSHPFKKLLHLLLNAVLYTTCSHYEQRTLSSPSPARTGEMGERRRAPPVLGGRPHWPKDAPSSESVFFLPGKIIVGPPAGNGSGGSSDRGEIAKRTWVRGHWRRANPEWSDKRLRWIEPYIRGPEMAALVEREYRLRA